MMLRKNSGIDLRINPLFVLMFLFYAWLGMLDFILGVLICVVLHELIHTWAAYRAGIEVKKIEIFPFGGAAQLKDEIEFNPNLEIQISMAGPLFNFFIYFLLAFLSYRNILTGDLILLYMNINLWLALFNMLPVLPLDGGRIFRALLVRHIGFKRATIAVSNLGRILGLLCILSGIYTLLFYHSWLNLVVIGFFLYIASTRERMDVAYRFINYLSQKNSELREAGVLPADHLIAFEETEIKDLLHFFVPRQYHLVLVLDRQWRITGSVTESMIIKALAEKGGNISLKDIF